MIWDWLRRRPLLIDSVLTAALLAGYVGAAVHHHHDVALGVVLALAQAGTVLARRFYPVLVLAVVVAATIGWVFVFRDWVPIAPALAVYTVAAHRPRRISLRATAATVVAFAGPVLWLDHNVLPAASRMIPLAAAWISATTCGPGARTPRSSRRRRSDSSGSANRNRGGQPRRSRRASHAS